MIADFLRDNFFYLHPGYTIFNTIVFGIVLGIIIIGIINVFKKINKNPLDLIYPLIPIITFGSTSRALVDNHIYPRIHILATPGIYITIGLFTIFLLIGSVLIEKYYGTTYYKIIFLIGVVLCVPNIFIMTIHGINLEITILELLIWAFIILLFILIKDKIRILSVKGNLEVISAHIFDATSTFVAIDFFGYYEQHVLPTFLINYTKTAIAMYPLKIIVILIILYIIDKEIKEKNTNNMLKLAIFILGLAPGIRNFATLILSMS